MYIMLPPIFRIAFCTSPLLPSVIMRSRKNPTKAPPFIPPRPMSGLPGGRRPPNIATNWQALPTSLGTVETESPQSETSPEPQATTSLPPRPPTFPHLPPGVGGLRRQTIRSNTYDIYAPVLEEHVPSQPQSSNVMTMPSPQFPQIPGHPPPTPIRPRQPAPGGGVGGLSPMATPFHHGPSHNDPYHDTADHTYQAGAPTRSDSGPPQYRSEALTGGIHAKVWPTYNKVSGQFDERMLEKWMSDLDVLLVFVSLVFGRDR